MIDKETQGTVLCVLDPVFYGLAPVIGLGLTIAGSLVISHYEDKDRQRFLGVTEEYYV